MKVGHEISKAAHTVSFGQIQMKRVICEMGGKNAIVIDDDADLDEAVVGVIKSAFLYAGQKCSAASRAIVVGGVKDQFIERLVEAVNSISIGSSVDPGSFMGPVIDKEAYERLMSSQEKLKRDSSIKVLQQGQKLEGGYFVPTMVVLVEDPSHWVMQEELFGPILAIYHAPDLPHAINIANNTRYALTGAFYSRSPKNIAYGQESFLVGNLYINQKCTGALVYRQPFGGFKMSGTGIKAGGPYYLLNFVDMKLTSENTMRRGFTPEVSI
jgi:RHH-type proline utilization regulon transcriptional repressor/proline dehydrogenase/delta 1-pyrroline-5-carboxylate dehydrogenase